MKIIWLTFFILIFVFSTFAQEVKKMDEISNIACDDYVNRIQNVIWELKNNSDSKVYFLIYDGKEVSYNAKKDKDELVLPIYGSKKARIRSVKKFFKVHQQESLLERIVFVEAGFREEFTVEFWQVPLGAQPPKPTPTLTKMKYRKGKPKEFCLGCC